MEVSPIKGILDGRIRVDSPVLSPRKPTVATTVILKTYAASLPTRTPTPSLPDQITPTKILDAPALADDYYLNLLDWSVDNLLAVGLGRNVWVWNAVSGESKCIASLGEPITSVGWSVGGMLGVGLRDGRIHLTDVRTGQSVSIQGAHSSRIGVIAWNGPDRMTSGSRDKSILHFDLRQQQCIARQYGAHEQEVCGMQWDRMGRLATGGNDNILNVWDCRMITSTPVHRWMEHNAAVKAIAWSPCTGGMLASGGGTADKTIRLWSVHSPSQSLSIHPTTSQVCSLAWSSTGELCSTHGFSEHLCLRWSPAMRITGVMRGHYQRVLYMAAAPDGISVATGSPDETIRIWPVFSSKRPRGSPHQRTSLLDYIDYR